MEMLVQIIINSLITGSIYAAIAFGFTMIYGTMNFFNMAYGTNVMVGAYFFYVFYRMCSIPMLVSIVLACVVTAGLMVGIDRVCYFGFRQKRVPSWTTVAVSMAVGTLLQAVITILFSSSKVTVYGKIPQTFSLPFHANITSIQLISLITVVVLMLAVTAFLKKTKTGKRIRAITSDKTMAKVVGIDVERIYIAIICVSSVLAATAGILYSLDSDLRPTMAATALLKAIVASIVGGIGNVRGALIAAFAIGLIENLAIFFVGSGWRDAIPLVLIVIFMLVKPSAFGIEET